MSDNKARFDTAGQPDPEAVPRVTDQDFRPADKAFLLTPLEA